MNLLIFNRNKKTPASKAQPRRRVVPLWRRRGAVPVYAALLLALLAGGGWWTVDSGLAQRWIEQGKWQLIALSGRLGFTVNEILVVGRHETEQAELLKAVRLARGAPIFAFDLKAAQRRVEALPWVRRAIVQRVLPDTVYLRIEERKPLALWQHEGRFSLIDTSGTVFLRHHLERFASLPVVVGDKAPDHAAEIIRILDLEPELKTKVKAAVRVSDRRWNLRMVGNIDVRLPAGDPASAWRRLAEYERRHKILGRDVQVLDLRQPDRLIVRTRANSETTKPAPGRET